MLISTAPVLPEEIHHVENEMALARPSLRKRNAVSYHGQTLTKRSIQYYVVSKNHFQSRDTLISENAAGQYGGFVYKHEL